ncbi:hypothetical protein [Paracoccus beibuensis]|uniref:hypothetical protein n=1 Tax=Paracoccus beibuensis TaxID=547602 RepID=UPI00223EF1D6|nr:hypothetical protein [Paracoccus beibuensis]
MEQRYHLQPGNNLLFDADAPDTSKQPIQLPGRQPHKRNDRGHQKTPGARAVSQQELAALIIPILLWSYYVTDEGRYPAEVGDRPGLRPRRHQLQAAAGRHPAVPDAGSGVAIVVVVTRVLQVPG